LCEVDFKRKFALAQVNWHSHEKVISFAARFSPAPKENFASPCRSVQARISTALSPPAAGVCYQAKHLCIRTCRNAHRRIKHLPQQAHRVGVVRRRQSFRQHRQISVVAAVWRLHQGQRLLPTILCQQPADAITDGTRAAAGGLLRFEPSKQFTAHGVNIQFCAFRCAQCLPIPLHRRRDFDLLQANCLRLGVPAIALVATQQRRLDRPVFTNRLRNSSAHSSASRCQPCASQNRIGEA